MKVAHITTIDLSLRYLLYNQLVSLRHAHYDVIGISSAGPEVAGLEAAGIQHISVPMTRHFSPARDLLAVWRLYGVMRREKFTIVHTHNPKPGLLGQLAARFAGVPVVVNTLHGFYFHDHMHALWRRFYITIEKIAARCSDVILSQNMEDIHTAVREGITSPDKIKYLGNGIDVAMFNPARVDQGDVCRARESLNIGARTRVVGFVGRLAARRKGFLDFVRACQIVSVQNPDTVFLVVGDDDPGKDDRVDPRMIHNSLAAAQCRFLGQRPNADLPALYSLMDVLVLPSLFEGIPRVIMEASAMAVPVVATDVKGNREAVVHGRTGLLVPLGDVGALAGAIMDVLADREAGRRTGAEGRRLALERFDERAVFDKVKAEYARLLCEKGMQCPLN